VKSEKVCLKAIMVSQNGKRCWSGEYKCSACGARFRPDPSDAGKLSREFADHQESQHAGEPLLGEKK
jgi:DNA-directed RNA polymerase subunit RPC12/RpoP